jgi:hypothetical protein
VASIFKPYNSPQEVSINTFAEPAGDAFLKELGAPCVWGSVQTVPAAKPTE